MFTKVRSQSNSLILKGAKHYVMIQKFGHGQMQKELLESHYGWQFLNFVQVVEETFGYSVLVVTEKRFPLHTFNQYN